MKRKMKSSSKLPRHAPKRTGRRGIGPAGEALRPPGDEPPKKPRQARLPQMEDSRIEALEAKAEEYADVRDQRMALTPQEKKLKDDLLALMKANNKERYFRDGIEIKVVHEHESVKVRLKKTEEEASAAIA